jgi:hypothetical protein
MEVTVRHIFDVDIATYWEDLFFDEAYQRALHLEGLGCVTAEIQTLETDAEGRVHQTILVEPRVAMPGPVRKILGERVRYVEDGQFDPADKRYRFQIIPSTLKKRSEIKGLLWVEPVDEHRVERFCKMTVEVKLRGAGKLIEKFILGSYVKNIEIAAQYTASFIQRRYGAIESRSSSAAQGPEQTQTG